MNTKRCPRCENIKTAEEFGYRADGRLRAWCKTCKSQYDYDMYHAPDSKTKKAIGERRIRYRHVVRRFILDYLREHPCVDCGEGDVVVLDFDHVRGQKKFTISSSIARQISIAKIKKEIDKCEVRCANCHRRKTAKEGNSYRQGV